MISPDPAPATCANSPTARLRFHTVVREDAGVVEKRKSSPWLSTFLSCADLRPRTRTSLLWVLALCVFLVSTALKCGVLAFFAHASPYTMTLSDYALQWDPQHYLRIAEVGYFGGTVGGDAPVEQTSMAFFPALPFSMRAVHVLGVSYVVAGYLVVAVACVAMIAAILALADRCGASTPVMVVVAFVLVTAPLGITYTTINTEALFGAFALWALVAMMDRRWWCAGLLTALCGLVRLTALDLVVVFFLVVLIKARTEWRAWVSVVVSPLPLAAYILYVDHYTASVGGYFGIQKQGWGSSFDYGASTLRALYSALFLRNDVAGLLVVGSILGSLILLIVALVYRTPLELWLFGAGVFANVALSGGIMSSRPRLLLPVMIVALPLLIDVFTRCFAASRAHSTSPLSVCWRLWPYCVALGCALCGCWASSWMLVVYLYAV